MQWLRFRCFFTFARISMNPLIKWAWRLYLSGQVGPQTWFSTTNLKKCAKVPPWWTVWVFSPAFNMNLLTSGSSGCQKTGRVWPNWLRLQHFQVSITVPPLTHIWPQTNFLPIFLKVIYGNFLLKPLGKILQWHLFLCYILPIVLQPESGVFETVPKGKRADIHLSKELSPHCTLDVNSNMRTVLYSENHKRHKEYRDKDE